MPKNILIISSSPRKGGNSDLLCDAFAQGAKESGNAVEKIRLSEKKIAYCTGCGYCNDAHVCSQKDDMAQLLEKMKRADAIVLSTPVYFYSMCGQLKTFIDRCCPAYSALSNKEFYYILSAADGDEGNMKKTVEGLRGFTLDCLDDPVEKAIVYGVGAWKAGEIKHTPAYDQAYLAGKNA